MACRTLAKVNTFHCDVLEHTTASMLPQMQTDCSLVHQYLHHAAQIGMLATQRGAVNGTASLHAVDARKNRMLLAGANAANIHTYLGFEYADEWHFVQGIR
jgi:hypothetical protein